MNDNNNNQINIHKDVWTCIFAACGQDIVVLKMVSRDINKYIMNWSQLNGFCFKIGLKEYGVKYGYPNIIMLAYGPNEYYNNNIIGKAYLGIDEIDDECWFETFRRVINVATQRRHFEMMKFAINNIPILIRNLCTTLSKHGYLDELIWAYNTWKESNDAACKLSEIAIDATIFGHLNILKWVYQIWKESNDAACNISKISIYAASYGHVNILKWIYEIEPHNINMTRCSYYAAKTMNTNVLQWILMTGHTLELEIYYLLEFRDERTKLEELIKILWKYNPNRNDVLYQEIKNDFPLQIV